MKHHDTVEIDHNSFCTILELCSGPDLYNYLKENKLKILDISIDEGDLEDVFIKLTKN